MKDSNRTIGEIVAEDFRTAKVFEDHGIDFCCGGSVALSVACMEKGIELSTISAELVAIKAKVIERDQNYTSWELSFLADYIINVHHAYLKENIEQIAAYVNKIADVHGDRHPEVIEIASIFNKITTDLTVHLREEEEDVFPAIKRADLSKKTGIAPAVKDTKMIMKALKKLTQEHDEIGEAVHKIRHLARGYVVPDDVCNTFTVTYQKLREFEDDLHKHVHLENNILFPKAVQL